jgi:AbrB family looped-hinge helix DNA binding protein
MKGVMMRITSKGQVTIPKDMCDRYGFQPGAEVEFVAEGDALRLVHSPASRRGKKPVKK